MSLDIHLHEPGAYEVLIKDASNTPQVGIDIYSESKQSYDSYRPDLDLDYLNAEIARWDRVAENTLLDATRLAARIVKEQLANVRNTLVAHHKES